MICKKKSRTAVTLAPSHIHTRTIRAKLVQDVVNGRALAVKRLSVSDIRGLCVSPVGVVEGRKRRIIHNLTLAGDGWRSSANDDIDFSASPSCELGDLFGDICGRTLYLRQRHGGVVRVMLCRLDVKDAFRQIPVDPMYAIKLGYAFGEYALVNLFLRFGWCGSPGN